VSSPASETTSPISVEAVAFDLLSALNTSETLDAEPNHQLSLPW
jgi:hypothetical protein